MQHRPLHNILTRSDLPVSISAVICLDGWAVRILAKRDEHDVQ
jgi:hypothetical protein